MFNCCDVLINLWFWYHSTYVYIKRFIFTIWSYHDQIFSIKLISYIRIIIPNIIFVFSKVGSTSNYTLILLNYHLRSYQISYSLILVLSIRLDFDNIIFDHISTIQLDDTKYLVHSYQSMISIQLDLENTEYHFRSYQSIIQSDVIPNILFAHSKG